MPSKINIVSWNARGISARARIANLHAFTANNNPDIIVIQETFLNHQHKTFIPNFTCVRRDRAGHGGGVATFIRHGLKFAVLSDLPLKCVEHVGIKLLLGATEFIVYNIYIPQNHRAVKSDLKKLFSVKNVIVVGDFNARHTAWNNIDNNAVGKKLFEVLPFNDMHLYTTDECTYFRPNGGSSSIIDFALSNLHRPITPCIEPQLISDHVAVSFDIVITFESTPRKKLDFNKANWPLYQQYIEERIFQNPIFDNTNEIDATLHKFTELIKESCEIAVPKIIVPDAQPVISNTTKRLIAEKNTANRRKQRSNDPVERAHLSSIVKNLKSLIEQNVNLDRNKNWEKLIKKADQDPKKFWATAKMIRKKGEPVPALIINGRETNDGKAKADALADVFSAAHNTHDAAPNFFDLDVEDEFATVKNEPVDGPVNYFDWADVSCIINGTRKKKAPGLDGITNVMLKALPQSAIQFLTSILNHCIHIGYWPTPYKSAIVVPIKKSGKAANDPGSYRPISLLSSIGKIFERAILQIIKQECDNRSIIPKHQFGFRNFHCAAQQATRLSLNLHQNKRNKLNSGVLALDIAKAFDSVWHAGLIYKLGMMGFPDHVRKLVASFCTDRSFIVRIGSERSTTRPIPAGCPQGSALSPVLYTIYTADIPTPKNTEMLTFADDTAVIVASKQSRGVKNKLTKAIVSLNSYFNRWHIKANADKTQFLYVPFDRRARRLPNGPILFDQHELIPTNTIKYLGVIFDKRLKFHEHIEMLRARVLFCAKALFPMYAGRHLSDTNRKKLIKQILKPSLLYAAPAWAGALTSRKVRLRRGFSMAAKQILRLPRRHSTVQLYDVMNMSVIETTIDNSRAEMVDRLLNTNAPNLVVLAEDIRNTWLI